MKNENKLSTTAHSLLSGMSVNLNQLKNSVKEFKEKLREEFDYKTNVTTIIRKLVTFIDELVLTLFIKTNWIMMFLSACFRWLWTPRVAPLFRH